MQPGIVNPLSWGLLTPNEQRYPPGIEKPQRRKAFVSLRLVIRVSAGIGVMK